MKKRVLMTILCAALLCSAASIAAAEDLYETTLSGCTVGIDQVSVGDGFSVGLSALFDTEAEALGYAFDVLDGTFTPEAAEAAYRAEYAEIADPPRLLLFAFRTPEGTPFLPDDVLARAPLSMHYEPYPLAEGVWRCEMSVNVDGFDPEADALVVDLYTFDPHADAPFPDAPAGTLRMTLPER